MSTPPSDTSDRRWPRAVYGLGEEPDPRFSLANERTFLAWMRTALGFVAAGVAIAAVTSFAGRLEIEVRITALILIASGLISAGGGLLRWAENERALRLGRRLPSTVLLPVVTGSLVVVAVVAAVVIGVGG